MTLADLAKAINVNERTLHRLRDRGMPMPANSRPTAAWIKKATEWRAANRGRPGVPPGAQSDKRQRNWSAESVRALALQRMHNLRVMRGEVMSRSEVEREWVARAMAVRTTLLALPRTMARRLANATADTVEQELSVVVNDILRAYCSPSTFTPAPGSPVAVQGGDE